MKPTKCACAAAALASILTVLLFVAGCAPTTNERGGAPSGEEGDGAPTVQVTWTPDADCALCHAEEGSSLASIPCPAEKDGNRACVTCHADEASLSSVHEGKTTGDKMPKKLKATEVASDTCESCHGTYAELAVKTAASTALTDSKGTVVNPHDLPGNAEHESLACADCHQMHSDGDAAKTAPKACSSCHHAGVYECNTCHEAS